MISRNICKHLFFLKRLRTKKSLGSILFLIFFFTGEPISNRVFRFQQQWESCITRVFAKIQPFNLLCSLHFIIKVFILMNLHFLLKFLWLQKTSEVNYGTWKTSQWKHWCKFHFPIYSSWFWEGFEICTWYIYTYVYPHILCIVLLLFVTSLTNLFA